MDGNALLDLLLERLDSSDLSETSQLLVLAAYEGPAELDQALEGAARGERPPRPEPEPVDVPRTYLKTIDVRGFRGVGQPAALRLQPGPGLTLVVGRNGSGKSSFAEAAEVALTGTNARWADRAAVVWKNGWRNLHATAVTPAVAVELAVDGSPGSTTVQRSWAGEDVDDSEGWFQAHGAQRQPIDALGWGPALEAYRPFLSYAELGSMLTGRPSDLYDALFSILGLETVAAAQSRLKDAHKQLDDAAKRSSAGQKALQALLTGVDDNRARAVVAALRGRNPDLAAVEVVLHTGTSAQDDLGALQAWARLQPPDAVAAQAVAARLRDADERARQVAGTQSGRARGTAALLEQAMAHVGHTASQDCPVCGAEQRLDDAWRREAEDQVARLRAEAADADAAAGELRAALAAAAALAAPAPALLEDVPSGVPAQDLAARWRAWSQAAGGADASAAVSALAATGALAEQVIAASAAAAEELSRREDVWRPLADQVTSWLVSARDVAGQAGLRVALKQAGDWLRAEADGLRDARLAPLGARSAEVWETLRQESNVELGPVRLEGAANRRRVTLDVTIDGVAGAALGVMSQGELHALALSLFLPRAMLEESPFRFLVIDDPVQAMDPAKVDGLARVLHTAAATHQVVVFTHDDRLPEALRRLQLPATVWEVVRRESSVVELKKSADPVQRYLDDARALANATDLSVAVLGRAVPAMCRGAVEAACHEVVRRRRLDRGDGHASVETLLAGARTTNQVMALALFDDVTRGGDVLSRLNAWGPWAATAYNVCRKGVHESYAGDLKALAGDVERLVKKLRA